jgi:hypothetical protein
MSVSGSCAMVRPHNVFTFCRRAKRGRSETWCYGSDVIPQLPGDTARKNPHPEHRCTARRQQVRQPARHRPRVLFQRGEADLGPNLASTTSAESRRLGSCAKHRWPARLATKLWLQPRHQPQRAPAHLEQRPATELQAGSSPMPRPAHGPDGHQGPFKTATLGAATSLRESLARAA